MGACPSCQQLGRDKSGRNLSIRYDPREGRMLIWCHNTTLPKCTPDDILAAVGMDWRDAVIVPKSEAFFDKYDELTAPTAAAPARRAKPAAPAAPPAKKWWERPHEYVCHYAYTDETGKELYWVHRVEFRDEEGGKTFRQSKPNPRKGVQEDWKGPAKDTMVLYRLPEVMAAIKDGRTVYVVEGEKDADTLVRLGRVATTNAGGAGKWLDRYSEQLRGADVVILPDNDEVGRNHGQLVVDALAMRAKRVRLVNLVDGFAELKKKGDFTDLCEATSDKAALALLDALVAEAPDVNAEEVPGAQVHQAVEIQTPEAPREEAKEGPKHDDVPKRSWDMTVEQDRYDRLRYILINYVPKVTVYNGKLCRPGKESTPQWLCNFVCYVREEVTVYDGWNRPQRIYRVEGWTNAGKKLPDVELTPKVFDKMEWPTEEWGIRASVSSLNTARGLMREAFTEASRMMYSSIDRYTYTGWEKIGGEWVYLMNGQSIGADGMDVQITQQPGSPLLRYGFTADDNADYESYSLGQCMQGALSIIYGLPRYIGIPLIGFTFLVPLQEMLSRAKCTPSFMMFLCGEYRTGKSEVARLALSFYGDFVGDGPMPSTFQDSAASVRLRASVLKDVLMVVDDYKRLDGNAMKNENNVVDYLARSFADKATRNIGTAVGG